jgi:hypothetical protein
LASIHNQQGLMTLSAWLKEAPHLDLLLLLRLLHMLLLLLLQDDGAGRSGSQGPAAVWVATQQTLQDTAAVSADR